MRRGAQPGAHDNLPLIREIAFLRAEQARLLGYDDYGAYALDNSMAKDAAAVERLLLEVWAPARRKAIAEAAELEALAQAQGLNAAIEPGTGAIMPRSCGAAAMLSTRPR